MSGPQKQVERISSWGKPKFAPTGKSIFVWARLVRLFPAQFGDQPASLYPTQQWCSFPTRHCARRACGIAPSQATSMGFSKSGALHPETISCSPGEISRALPIEAPSLWSGLKSRAVKFELRTTSASHWTLALPIENPGCCGSASRSPLQSSKGLHVKSYITIRVTGLVGGGVLRTHGTGLGHGHKVRARL